MLKLARRGQLEQLGVSPLLGVALPPYFEQVSNLDLVTTAEAVEITGRNRFALYRLAKKGELPAFKSPTTTGAYLFSREDVEALAKTGDKDIAA